MGGWGEGIPASEKRAVVARAPRPPENSLAFRDFPTRAWRAGTTTRILSTGHRPGSSALPAALGGPPAADRPSVSELSGPGW